MENTVAKAFIYEEKKYLEVDMFNFNTGGIYCSGSWRKNYKPSEFKLQLGIKHGDDKFYIGDYVVIYTGYSTRKRLIRTKRSLLHLQSLLAEGAKVEVLIPRKELV